MWINRLWFGFLENGEKRIGVMGGDE